VLFLGRNYGAAATIAMGGNLRLVVEFRDGVVDISSLGEAGEGAGPPTSPPRGRFKSRSRRHLKLAQSMTEARSDKAKASRPSRADRAAGQTDYKTWKARAAALLERQGISLGVMRERDWRQLFITGVTPEQAVERTQVHYNNTRPPFERMRGKRR
jgi:hypothetical protein